jgi:hypothetical protein
LSSRTRVVVVVFDLFRRIPILKVVIPVVCLTFDMQVQNGSRRRSSRRRVLVRVPILKRTPADGHLACLPHHYVSSSSAAAAAAWRRPASAALLLKLKVVIPVLRG